MDYPRLVSLSVRLYRRLLGCYPPAFREAYGREMTVLFQTHCRITVRQAGSGGLLQV